MKIPARIRNGSAMILALLVIAVMGVVTAGWITLVTARSGMVEQTAAASQRRIALENSKALALEFMLERVMTSVSGNAFEYSLSDPAWGGITVPGWSSAPLQSIQKAAGVNLFSPGNGDGYTFDLSPTLRDGVSSFQRKYQVRSRSPLLSGSLLTSQTPTITPTALTVIGGLTVDGASFVWSPNLSMGFSTSSYSAPATSALVSLLNLAGSAVASNNLALPRQIANPRSSGLLYSGQFDAIGNSNAAANSSAAKATSGGVTVNGLSASSSNGVVCDGLGNVVITLNTPGLTNVYIPGGILTLTLVGQSAANNSAADDLPAVLIVVDQPGASLFNLTTVTLSNHNSRRVDLAIKKATSLVPLAVLLTTTSASWRLLLEAENTPMLITALGVATIKGGIRSDRSVTLTGGARITPETDPKYLERLATRTAWVESIAQ